LALGYRQQWDELHVSSGGDSGNIYLFHDLLIFPDTGLGSTVDMMMQSCCKHYNGKSLLWRFLFEIKKNYKTITMEVFIISGPIHALWQNFRPNGSELQQKSSRINKLINHASYTIISSSLLCFTAHSRTRCGVNKSLYTVMRFNWKNV